jgi:endonuclease-3
LPGVGRKTANVVLPNAFGVPGLAVDTHVTRLAGRLALSGASDPRGIEGDLTALYPEKDWAFVSHALIWHGRRVCDARRPRCDECVVAAECPAAFAGPWSAPVGERDVTERRRTAPGKTRSRRRE